jgi:hypothetical protein
MEYVIDVKYDRPLIRRALHRFMLKRLGKVNFALIIVLSVFLIFEIFSSQWSYLSTIFLVLWVIMVGLLVIVYFARLNSSEVFFQKSKNDRVQFIFSEDEVKTISDVGNSQVKWIVFDEILKFSDVWLLVYAKSGYMTIPLEYLTPELKSFLERKIIKDKV